jgi:spore coat polysaccharide biosynthesis protein SpsF (cytidylyltransferase family)
MNTVAIALARMGSTRFPGKVLKPLDGQPVLEWVMSALTRANLVDLPVLATSTLPADDVIAEYCNRQKWACFRGDEEDVLDRFYQCAKHYSADIVLRVTCDCPFLDPRVIDEVIKLREITNAHYCSNVDPPTWPDGLDIECFTFTALEAAWRDAVRPSDRNCVTQFITRNRSHLNAANLTCPLPGLHKERWVLDTDQTTGSAVQLQRD